MCILDGLYFMCITNTEKSLDSLTHVLPNKMEAILKIISLKGTAHLKQHLY